MTKTTFRIYKYPLRMADFQNIEVDGGIMVHSIAKQHGKPILYIVVDTEKIEYQKKVIFDVWTIGTGNDIPFDPDGPSFDNFFTFDPLGTLSFADEELMFHYYVRKRLPNEEFAKN